MNQLKTMKKILNFILYGFNIVSIISLLLAYISKFISPSLFWIASFAGMGFSFILLCFIFFTFLLGILRKWKWLLLNLSLIIVGLPNINLWFQWNSPSQEQQDLRVMSYNVRLFGLYAWENDFKTKSMMLKNIQNQNIDVVAFQEFFFDYENFSLESYSKALGMPYYYIADSKILRKKDHFGQAVFSKYPIINASPITFPGTSNMSFYCDIKLSEQKVIRVFNAHLESYRFQSEHYELLKDIENGETTVNQNLYKKTKSLILRLKNTMIKRSYQAEKLSAFIHSSNFPVIVTGDFNDTPHSYTYRQIANGLDDSFVEAGNGFSNTYLGAFPSFRIDYVLNSKHFKAIRYQRVSIEGSDHYPLVVDFKFANP